VRLEDLLAAEVDIVAIGLTSIDIDDAPTCRVDFALDSIRDVEGVLTRWRLRDGNGGFASTFGVSNSRGFAGTTKNSAGTLPVGHGDEADV
jgi:hypothetical protein